MFLLLSLIATARAIVVPSSVLMGTTPTTDTCWVRVGVSNDGTDTISISSVSFVGNGFVLREGLPRLIAPGAADSLTVGYYGTSAGNFAGTLIIRYTDTASQQVSVQLRGSRYEPNELELVIDTAMYNQPVHVHVNLNNASSITAVQFTLVVPEGFSFNSSTLSKSGRCPMGDALMSSVVGGNWCVMMLSMSNELISGNSGEIITFDLDHDTLSSSQERTVSLTNIVLSNTNGTNLASVFSAQGEVVLQYPTVTDTIVAEVCQGITYAEHGFLVDTSGTYVQELTTVMGGDSIVVLQLTVHPSFFEAEDTTILENDLPFLWCGDTLYESGQYLKSDTTLFGCDSIHALNLTILYGTSDSLFASACDSMQWRGRYYFESGVYIDSLTNYVGADSLIVLVLTIHHGAVTQQEVVLSTSELPYLLGDESFDSFGEYNVHLRTVHGCDSLIQLSLRHNTRIESPIDSPKVTLYPNPTTHYVHISCNTEVKFVEVIDLKGEVVIREDSSKGVDLSRLARGTYYLRLVTPSGVVIEKIQKV